MSNLKTTKEERARLREEAPCIVVEFGTNNDGYTGTSPRNEEVISILDDLDTLEAEVERLLGVLAEVDAFACDTMPGAGCCDHRCAEIAHKALEKKP
jgi:hypothetical protein